MDWYPMYPKDWIEGTAHMTAAQRGVYCDLLAHQWCRPRCELPLAHEELARMVRLSLSEFEDAWRSISDKFSEGKTGYRNRRLRKEWLKARRIRAKRAEFGRKGGVAKARNLLQQKARPSDGNGSSTNEVSTTGGGDRGVQGGAVEIPEPLRTPAFTTAWSDWLEYRSEKRKPVTKRAAGMQLKKLATVGPAVAVAAIEQAIANDWQGLFPDKIAPHRPAKDGHRIGPDGLPITATYEDL
jgi:uncharacterized protein YdaU (DUF1376 family)